MSVCWLVGRLVCWLIGVINCDNFLKGRKFSLLAIVNCIKWLQVTNLMTLSDWLSKSNPKNVMTYHMNSCVFSVCISSLYLGALVIIIIYNYLFREIKRRFGLFFFLMGVRFSNINVFDPDKLFTQDIKWAIVQYACMHANLINF